MLYRKLQNKLGFSDRSILRNEFIGPIYKNLLMEIWEATQGHMFSKAKSEPCQTSKIRV